MRSIIALTATALIALTLGGCSGAAGTTYVGGKSIRENGVETHQERNCHAACVEWVTEDVRIPGRQPEERKKCTRFSAEMAKVCDKYL
ncbi:MAG: hypothetical protein ACE366_04445 [Bradymonadia bacterium]